MGRGERLKVTGLIAGYGMPYQIAKRMSDNTEAPQEPFELKIPSRMRFVVRQKNRDPRIVEIDSGEGAAQPRRPRGRRAKVDGPVARASRAGTSLVTGELRRTKIEWGRAYKVMSEGVDPAVPVFMDVARLDTCIRDVYYLKLFREMAYGIFPRGVFFDRNRGCLTYTDPPRRMTAQKKRTLDVFIRVCFPSIPTGFQDYLNGPTTTTQSTDADEAWTADGGAGGAPHPGKVCKVIRRAYQRSELPVEELVQMGLSTERIFEEVKLFMFCFSDLISPRDLFSLREDGYHRLETEGCIRSEHRTPRTWERFTTAEKLTFIGLYCETEFRRHVPNLGQAHFRKLAAIKQYVGDMWKFRQIDDSNILFDPDRQWKVLEVRGVKITPKLTLSIDRELIAPDTSESSSTHAVAQVQIRRTRGDDMSRARSTMTRNLDTTKRKINAVVDSEDEPNDDDGK